MVRPKKQSKRLTLRKKYKIQRKVREHLRKQRKETNQKGKSKKHKKDPGVPNLFPFKEEILKQSEERRRRAEETNERRKQNRRKEMNKKRNLESLQKDAEKRQKEFEKKEATKENSHTDFCSGERSGGSLKAYYKEFKKVVDTADVVLEVLDARDPFGCRCPQVEKAVLSSGVNKKLVLILNKIDLVPKEIVDKWLKYLRNEFPTIAFKASTQSQKQNLHQSKVSASLASVDLLSSSACIGADTLLKLLGNYCRNKDIKTTITVGIVGFPNVGKSSIINSLKRSRACTVGATPGVTKSMQEVHLDKHVKLLDSPGIVMDSGKSDSAVILRNCVKIESIDDPVPSVEAILRRCNKKQVMVKYLVPDYNDVQEFLAHLGKRLGKLKKGGIPDVVAAGKIVLRDWNSGKIVFYTHPPEQHSLPTHLSADIVSEWSKEFDLNSLLEQEQAEYQGQHPSSEDAMVLEAGIPVDSAEIVEEEMDSDEEQEEEESDDDNDINNEREEEEGEEEMEGSDVETQKDNITVLLKTEKAVTQSLTKTETGLKADEVNEFNLQTNKERKKFFKKQQKERRKQAVSSIEAMEDSDDAYNFDTDFS
ncbi:guanine nucleotide-binding protein-like 3 homolog isoform X1 [Montipora capricornis]|uniref:guanine nucleotide-binding protein-like 3 homolog isoform X1 n=2 Tax=Montipora capricornis TaxID=246305 RepID=UPI0035F11B8C